ncbi:hypothetical protein SUGI_0622030 [Cryptomeria japonica]|nr:hypothetical protein SUGI_0622030 [Cryptomeria japonica]
MIKGLSLAASASCKKLIVEDDSLIVITGVTGGLASSKDKESSLIVCGSDWANKAPIFTERSPFVVRVFRLIIRFID